jgi:hypothetical protein
MRIAAYCGTCLARMALPVSSGDAPSGEVSCPQAHETIAFRHSEAVARGERVDRCSRCGKTAFYAQKDFDQRVGCAVLAAGAGIALAVSWRYGGVTFVPVLLLFVAVDLLLARRVGSVVICYRCDTEYRDVPGASTYKAYDPHIAERDAELKTVRRMNP